MCYLQCHKSTVLSEDDTLNEGAQEIVDAEIKIEPFEPTLIMTHFVRSPFLIRSCPARIGFARPVTASAWQVN